MSPDWWSPFERGWREGGHPSTSTLDAYPVGGRVRPTRRRSTPGLQARDAILKNAPAVGAMLDNGMRWMERVERLVRVCGGEGGEEELPHISRSRWPRGGEAGASEFEISLRHGCIYAYPFSRPFSLRYSSNAREQQAQHTHIVYQDHT